MTLSPLNTCPLTPPVTTVHSLFFQDSASVGAGRFTSANSAALVAQLRRNRLLGVFHALTGGEEVAHISTLLAAVSTLPPDVAAAIEPPLRAAGEAKAH